MPEVFLKVEALRKHFPVTKGLILQKTVGLIKAVDGVSFDIHKGETLALAGESGCGKTTTARLMLLLLRPTGGSVWFKAKDILAFQEPIMLREFRTSVQSVFQDPFSSLNERMRVGDIVSEPLVVNKKVSAAEVKEKIGEVLARVGLEPGDARLYPHEFSGGQRQRIAIARALSVNPSMIVLDEPVSALDISIRAQIMNLLRDFQNDSDVSYLLISHDLATIRYMSHRVAVMYGGKIVELAPTEELFSNLWHPYTEALVSAALTTRPGEQRKEIELRGEVPNPMNFPAGCRFHPRCWKAQSICSLEEPLLIEVKAEHWLACHLHGEMRA